jgi:hypothetical protein
MERVSRMLNLESSAFSHAGIKQVGHFLAAPALIAVIGFICYEFEGFAWPLSPGRDYSSYMVYFFDLLNPRPVYHLIMLYRTPIAPLVFGLLLTKGGLLFSEIAMAACYIITLMSVYYVARSWGLQVALIAFSLILLCPSHAWLYHAVSTEPLFSCAFMVWVAFIVFTYLHRSQLRMFALHGFLVFLLVMIRPTAQLYVPFFLLFPWILPKLHWLERVKRIFVFLAVIIPLLLLYSSYNYFRYDDFTVSRTGAFHIPFYRLFLDGLIRAENGPASLALVAAVKTDLLVHEPYRSHQIDEEIFFYGVLKHRRWRMLYDLVGLSDRTWGWDSDYRMLRAAAIEAMEKKPAECGRVFLLSFSRMLHTKMEYAAPRVIEPGKLSHEKQTSSVESGDEWIPRSYFQWTFSSPYIRPDRPKEPLSESDALHERMAGQIPRLPARNGSSLVASGLNFLTVLQPSMGAWLFLGLLGFLFRPHHDRALLFFLCGLALVVPTVSYLGIDDIPEFRTPFDPFFILFGVMGLWGSTRNKQNQSAVAIVSEISTYRS